MPSVGGIWSEDEIMMSRSVTSRWLRASAINPSAVMEESRPIIAEAVQVIGRVGISAREIHHDVAIDQVWHQVLRAINTAAPAGC